VKTSFEYITDPGHGWIKVPAVLLCRLDIADKVSSYSYWRKGHAYLEEDCDASLLFAALAARGKTPKLRARNRTHGDSRIRGYDYYRADHYR
jgi:hypothetical protein